MSPDYYGCLATGNQVFALGVIATPLERGLQGSHRQVPSSPRDLEPTRQLAIKTLAREIDGEESIHSCLIPEF